MLKISKRQQMICNVVLSILGLVWLAPIIFVVLNIFKTKQEYNMGSFWQLPHSFAVIDNFKNVVANKLFVYMGSSLLYAVGGAVLAVFFSLLAAYGLTHLRIKHNMFWFLFIYSGTIFPFQVYLIPIYRGYYKTGLYNTKFGMILFYCAISIPFAMFVLRNFLMGISSEICESAKMDGATNWQVLVHILTPMAKAPLTKSTNVRPVMASISMMSIGDVPSLFTACLLASIPTIVLFFVLQDNFEAGFAYTGK